MTPKAHQSVVLSWPLPFSISGDMYSGVPQNVFERVAYFARPKSVNLI